MQLRLPTIGVFIHPTLKNTFINTLAVLMIAIVGAAVYRGIDYGMTKIISLLF